MKDQVPYLCGGILLCLILQAKRLRKKARNKFKGGTDGLRNCDVMKSLVYVVTGEEPDETGDSYIRATTLYKSCQINDSPYIPFKEKIYIEAFDKALKRNDLKLITRITEFIYKYISEQKYEWLVKSILDLIKHDAELSDNVYFFANKEKKFTKSDVDNISNINLPIFILSALRFILLNRPENTKGRETFISWHTQKTNNGLWKLSFNIGSSIKQKIEVNIQDLNNYKIDNNLDNDSSKDTLSPEYIISDTCNNNEFDTDTIKRISLQKENKIQIINQKGEKNIYIENLERLEI